MRTKWKTIVFLTIVAFLGSVVTVRAFAGPQTTPTEKDVNKAGRVTAPKTGTDERVVVPAGSFVAGNGVIEPADRETKVSSHVAGRISTILVREGDFVEKGAAIAELDFAAEKAALDAAEGDLAGANAELTRTMRGLRREDVDAIIADADAAKARAGISSTSRERIEALAKTGAATPDELDKSRKQAEADAQSVAAAEARRKAALAGSRGEDILVARAKVQAAIGRKEQAKAAFERLTIRAPIAGQVLQIKTRVGEYFNPQSTEPVLIMGDTRKLRVRMDVDERDIARVQIGSSAFATLNAYPDKKFSGKVVELGKRMGRKNIRTDDPVERIDTKILEVVIELDKSDGLLPGLRVTSYIERTN